MIKKTLVKAFKKQHYLFLDAPGEYCGDVGLRAAVGARNDALQIALTLLRNHAKLEISFRLLAVLIDSRSK